jgi:hypothetical protein
MRIHIPQHCFFLSKMPDTNQKIFEKPDPEYSVSDPRYYTADSVFVMA